MYVEDGRIVLESRDQLATRLRREVAESWHDDGRGSAITADAAWAKLDLDVAVELIR